MQLRVLQLSTLHYITITAYIVIKTIITMQYNTLLYIETKCRIDAEILKKHNKLFIEVLLTN